MKFNDLSNKTAPVVAFNIDNILFSPKEKSIIDSVKKLFNPDPEKFTFFNRKVNQNAVDIIQNVWDNNEVSVYLLTFTDYENDISEILYNENVYYTRLQRIPGMDWLRRKCMYGFAFYFDTDKSLISNLSVDNAKEFSEIYKYLKV